MRLSNKSARLAVNHWLDKSGHARLSGALSYEQFAVELRKIMAPSMRQVPIEDRAEAVAYIRDIARAVSELEAMPEDIGFALDAARADRPKLDP